MLDQRKTVYGAGFAIASFAGLIGIYLFLTSRSAKRNLAISVACYAIGIGGVFFSLTFFVLANS
ncbi:hypothetical protein CW354_19190 [Marinicaulis flavus]|uniref:Uncharacterized protein n=1 Tax=Hyphococcus luteus TaxID=2058213 RepID=A0A2S7K1T5_9PROT|nr:hypothetical protein CW354_19190 [Marinicaulis flavus]